MCFAIGSQHLALRRVPALIPTTPRLESRKRCLRNRHLICRPLNIPLHPDVAYAHDGWEGFPHWLGCIGYGMEPPGSFVEDDYDPPLHGLEAREDDGSWYPIDVYRHTADGNLVLWYGGTEYAGICGNYRWQGDSSPGGEACSARVLLNDSGCVIATRLAHADTPGPKDAAHRNTNPQFLPFGEACVFARKLKLSAFTDWATYCNSGARPAYIPSHPDLAYKGNGWQGYTHWLGTGGVHHAKKDFLPFAKAREYAVSLGLASSSAWQTWSGSGARPTNVPSCPYATYKDDGWQGWGYWLGTGNVRHSKKDFLPFAKAREYAVSLGLAGRMAWQTWSSSGARPTNVPSSPHVTYKDDGWQGWGYWLGTGNVRHAKKDFLPFAKAREYAVSLGLAGSSAWQTWSGSGARPFSIPSHPNQFYKHSGWQSFDHWLGTDTRSTGESTPPRSNVGHETGPRCMPFARALTFARSLRLTTEQEWSEWCRGDARPPEMPMRPHHAYRHHGWQGYGHWLKTVAYEQQQRTVASRRVSVRGSCLLAQRFFCVYPSSGLLEHVTWYSGAGVVLKLTTWVHSTGG